MSELALEVMQKLKLWQKFARLALKHFATVWLGGGKTSQPDPQRSDFA